MNLNKIIKNNKYILAKNVLLKSFLKVFPLKQLDIDIKIDKNLNRFNQNSLLNMKNNNFFYNFSTIKHKQQQLISIQMQKQSVSQLQPDQVQQQKILQQNDPVLSCDLQLHQQIAFYQRSNVQDEDFKTRGTKRRQKLQKLRSNLKDPQLRRQRNRQRHQKQKQKLNKKLNGLSQQQIKQILIKRKTQKKQSQKRVRQAVQAQIGQTFLIDNAYQNKMNGKQNKSLAAQIQIIMKSLRYQKNPPNLHLCGVKGKLKQQLQVMKYQYWPLKSYTQDLKQVIQTQKFKGKNIYYLSPDAPKAVHSIQENDIFIIGGLVDRTVLKNASLNRAEELGIQARTLPIRPFMKQRTCLNLDHIVSIVCKFLEVQDWKLAFDHGAPKRWKKDEERGITKVKNSQNNQIQKQQQKSDQQSQQNQCQQKQQISKE